MSFKQLRVVNGKPCLVLVAKSGNEYRPVPLGERDLLRLIGDACDALLELQTNQIEGGRT